jgi:hypothetical protein
VAPGVSSSVPRAEATFRSTTEPSFMASGCHPTCWYGQWARSRKAWVSVPWRGCSRWTRTRCCSGWWRPRSISRPFPSISCTTCGSRRCNWMNSLPCSAPCRLARSVRRRPSPGCHAPRIGSGWPWTPSRNSCWRSTSGAARWPWRNAWSIRWCRCWPLAVSPCFSPMALRSTRPRC